MFHVFMFHVFSMTDLDFESAQLELLTEALRAGPGTPQWREAVASIDVTPGEQELAQTYFVGTRAVSNFEGDLGVEWSAFGPLGVEARNGLRPVLGGALDANTFRGGGMMYARDLAADQPFAVDATVRLVK